ncbi:hypothetical protein ACFODL_08930 [Phenylobacterium terrae]|uniref:Uncharacterized protein n=1 Tax=Phenylobacterium terrae TaxID=2665495 RepID=A0ABW4N589_9CAUL
MVSLTFLILQLNALIDAGAKATVGEAHAHIVQGDLLPWLKTAFPEIDLSPYGSGAPWADDASEIISELQSLHGGYAGDERRKWGVENNGLSVLLAWVNELVQQRKFHD